MTKLTMWVPGRNSSGAWARVTRLLLFERGMRTVSGFGLVYSNV
jgi:hypothetical protein